MRKEAHVKKQARILGVYIEILYVSFPHNNANSFCMSPFLLWWLHLPPACQSPFLCPPLSFPPVCPLHDVCFCGLTFAFSFVLVVVFPTLCNHVVIFKPDLTNINIWWYLWFVKFCRVQLNILKNRLLE